MDTELVVGASGEYTVWVDGTKVAEKTWRGFPDPKDIVAKVRAHAPA